MPRTVMPITATPGRPEAGILTSGETALDNVNGMSLVNDGKVSLTARCVNNGSVRFTYHDQGDSVTFDVVMTAGQRRTFYFDPKVFNIHALGVDSSLAYIDQVAGAPGDFQLSAHRPPAFS